MSLISNKKAYFNYEIGDKYVAGVELFGYEVKSIRAGQGNLEGSYIIVRGGEAFLVGAYIPPFQGNNAPKNYDDRRPRKLLLKKSEIAELALIESKKGSSILPLSFFAEKSKLKLELGIGRGKKQFDKRETLKKRDTDKDIRRDMKRDL